MFANVIEIKHFREIYFFHENMKYHFLMNIHKIFMKI